MTLHSRIKCNFNIILFPNIFNINPSPMQDTVYVMQISSTIIKCDRIYFIIIALIISENMLD